MLGMSQYQLARVIGIASQQIQKYEIGANRLSVSRLVEIAEALDVPIAWFFRNIQSPVQRDALDPHQGRNARPATERGRKTK
jgi:transcriptional regulator with XRE-family HTH domain